MENLFLFVAKTQQKIWLKGNLSPLIDCTIEKKPGILTDYRFGSTLDSVQFWKWFSNDPKHFHGFYLAKIWLKYII
jgi:hypothetical protein